MNVSPEEKIRKLLMKIEKSEAAYKRFIENPKAFFQDLDIDLTRSEKISLLSLDGRTLRAYKEGFDSRISKSLWYWYYMSFNSSGVIHAIPNVCYGGVSKHQFLLSDRVRDFYFKRALKRSITKNTTVADVGTGFGILAMWAKLAGAREVYAIEKDKKVLKIASELIKENDLMSIKLINKDAKEVKLPEKVDLVVSECLGSMGINTTFLPDLIDFKRNNLRKDGKLIPSAIILEVVPVETLFYRLWVNFARQELFGLSLDPLNEYLKNQVFNIIGDTKSYLAKPQRLFKLNLENTKNIDQTFSSSLNFKVKSSGSFHGFLGWFKARLNKDLTLDTAPDSPRTHWYQTFFPSKNPIEVKEGDRLSGQFEVTLGEKDIRWKWEIGNNDYQVFQDTKKSYP